MRFADFLRPQRRLERRDLVGTPQQEHIVAGEKFFIAARVQDALAVAICHLHNCGPIHSAKSSMQAGLKTRVYAKADGSNGTTIKRWRDYRPSTRNGPR